MDMNASRTVTIFLRVVLLWSIHATADERSFGPLIEGYGPTYPINDRDVPLRDNFVYKAVFDAAANADETKLNSGLVSVARYLNMHARNGVSVDNMDIAVVAHGPLCGQSIMFGGFEKEERVAPVKVALSAMTMMTELQSDGYALLR